MAVVVSKNGDGYDVKIDVEGKSLGGDVTLVTVLQVAFQQIRKELSEQASIEHADATIARLQAAKAKAKALPG